MEKSKYFNLIDLMIDLLNCDIEKFSMISLPDEGIVIKFQKTNPFFFFGNETIIVKVWSNKLNISLRYEYFTRKKILKKYSGSYLDPESFSKIDILDFKNRLANAIAG